MYQLRDAVKVDKRGRPLAGSHHQDQLKRFYRLRSPSPSASGSADPSAPDAAPAFIDFARGDGYLSSSGSEDEEEESEAEEDELEIGGKRRVIPRPGQEDTDSDSGDDSDASGSHLDIDLEEDEESAFPLEVIGEGDEEEEEEEDDGPTTDPTTRFAAVNLDWDNLRAADLFAVFNSFLKEGGRKIKGAPEMKGEGKLLGVKIYPSEFGKERMKREEMEGPGGGMFISKSGGKKGRVEEDSDDDDEEESGDEFDGSEGESGSDEGLVELSDEDEGEEEDSDMEDEEEEDDDDGLPASGKANAGDDISEVSSEAGSEDIDMDQLRQYQLERLR